MNWPIDGSILFDARRVQEEGSRVIAPHVIEPERLQNRPVIFSLIEQRFNKSNRRPMMVVVYQFNVAPQAGGQAAVERFETLALRFLDQAVTQLKDLVRPGNTCAEFVLRLFKKSPDSVSFFDGNVYERPAHQLGVLPRFDVNGRFGEI